MDNLYDVCVIGAGPSGSYSAYLLAKLGYKVLLLDKSKFPRDKCCGGFLSARAQKYLKPWECDIPIHKTISSLKLYSHKMESIEWTSSSTLGATILRKDFDNFIVNKAIDQGTKFYDGISISKIQESDDRVEIYTSIGVFTSRFLIGADGAFSFTAKHTGLVSKFRLYKMGYTCSQIITIENEVDDQSTIELYCIPFIGGFGWCFPLKNGLNIGVGASTLSYKMLHRYFYEFAGKVLAQKNITYSSIYPKGAFLPAGGFTRPLCKGRTLLIGDASGGVDPFSGEGLEHAFASALLAVDSIRTGSFEHPDEICYRYKEKYNKEIMPERRISLLMAIASWKKGDLFFDLFKHDIGMMKGFEIIMTHNFPYKYIIHERIRYFATSFLNVLNPFRRLNK